MNVIKVCGGIGNQLFQYAFGKAKEAIGYKVSYDLSWYRKFTDPPRPYRLDKFGINIQIAAPLTIRQLRKRRYVIREKNRYYNPALLTMNGFHFYGYWQNPLYHLDIFSDLRREIQILPEYYTDEFLRLRKIIANPSISIHVRRGDYVGKDIPGLSLNYYTKALEHLPEGDIYVFSDDIPWCKINFRDFKNVTFITGIEDYLAFELMRLCQYNIIANSTFSWWAAYLNGIPGKIVIRPYWWVTKKEETKKYENELYYPIGWVQVN